MTKPQKHSHCSFCGAPFPTGLAWPRRCAACTMVSYLSPSPVAILLLPVDAGLLVIRRGIPPHRGELALPGGFIDHEEEWRAAAARELFEETGIQVDPEGIRERRVLSAPGGTLLIFGEAQPVRAEDLPAFVPNHEVLERTVIHQPVPLAFELHALVVADFFARRA
jgi:8-oxo-dGTP pyrophosphatase MutT (NUDIX family)